MEEWKNWKNEPDAKNVLLATKAQRHKDIILYCLGDEINNNLSVFVTLWHISITLYIN